MITSVLREVYGRLAERVIGLRKRDGSKLGNIGRVDGALAVLMLSTADWDSVLWTNKQHTARALRDKGATVLYVESVGLRAPSLSAADVRRIARRLSRLVRPPVEVEPGIWRWSPPVIPLQRFRVVRKFNRVVLSLLLHMWTRKLLGPRPIVWTYNPLTTTLVRLPPHRTLVYHCVDNIAAQPGVHSPTVKKYEQELVKRADHVFVTSRELEANWSKHRKVHYDPNCVDVEHFSTANRVAVHPVLERIPQPRLGFVGAVAAYKIDVELLTQMACNHPEWSVVLIGPREDDDPSLSGLLVRPNVYYLGSVSYRDLPKYLAGFAVGLIPARLGEYAASMFPMKFFEYLASGIPVVSTNLPALDEYSSAAAIVDRSMFEAAVAGVLRGDVPPREVREEAYARNSYFARTSRMLDHITKYV